MLYGSGDAVVGVDPASDSVRLGPVVLARQARVALGDPIGAALNAPSVLMLIGERPGDVTRTGRRERLTVPRDSSDGIASLSS